MFGSRKKTEVKKVENRSAVESNSSNRIGQGTEIQGEIISDGTIRVEGRLDGYLESKSRIIIGETGYVKGDVLCESMDISGTVTGTVKVKDILFLKTNATVNGDIHARKLVIEPGANFNGNCHMGSSTPTIKSESKPKVGQEVSKKVG